MPTPPTEPFPVPPVIWDVIPDLYKTIITSAGPNLNPMHFQMVLGFIYRLRQHHALEPKKHNPKSPEVLEAWLKGTLLVLTDGDLSFLTGSLVNSLKELIPSYRPAPLPVMPLAPRLDGMPAPATIITPPPMPTGETTSFILAYEVDECTHGHVTYSRRDTLPCEGRIDLADYVGLSDEDIRRELCSYGRENFDDDAGNRDYGETEFGDEEDDESETGEVHLGNAETVIAAVREYERSHA